MGNLTPCRECPYRKNSAPGYLGEASFKPELFLQQLEIPDLHPCHLSVDWEKNKDTSDKPICAGALHFCKNTFKLPLGEHSREEVKNIEIRNEDVFSSRIDFINHHKSK